MAGEKALAQLTDLHNYVTQCYGLTARISDSGDTFSHKRVRYLLIQIGGKTLKCFNKIDPSKLGSTIPVDISSKEDLPSLLKLTSDLAIRREKAIIDMMMEEAGIAKIQDEYTLEAIELPIKEKEVVLSKPTFFGKGKEE